MQRTAIPIIAVDCSASVHKQPIYWSVVSNFLDTKDFKLFILWNRQARIVSRSALVHLIHTQKGTAVSNPLSILELLKKQELKFFQYELTIITDGNIPNVIVQPAKFQELFKDSMFYKVKVHIVNIDPRTKLTPIVNFVRGMRASVILHSLKSGKGKVILQTHPKQMKFIQKLQYMAIEDFVNNFGRIQDQLITDYMGKPESMQLRDRLLNYKKKAIKDISQRKKEERNWGSMIKTALVDNKNQSEALQLAQDMTNQYFSQNLIQTMTKEIDSLINLIKLLPKIEDWDSVVSNRVGRSQQAHQVPLVNLKYQISAQAIPFDCPIFFDEDVPVMLINKGKPVLASYQKKIVEDVLSCPLRLVMYSDLYKRLKDRMTNIVGLRFLKAHQQKHYGKLINPFTNLEVQGYISLGLTESHIQQADAAIYHLISGGAKIGCPSLHFATIWYLASKSPMYDQHRDVLNQVMSYRCRNSISYISLSGLPSYPIYKAPLEVALWYSLSSAALVVDPKGCAARYHVFSQKVISAILKTCGIQIDERAMHELDRVKCLLRILNFSKKKRYYLELLTKALLYKGTKIPKQVRQDFKVKQYKGFQAIFTQQPPKQSTIKKLKELYKVNTLTQKQIYGITNSIDPSLNSKDLNLAAIQQADPDLTYNHWDSDPTLEKFIKICPLTMRPYSMIDGKTWEQLYQEDFKKPKEEIKDISYHKFYAQFVCKHNFYPQRFELLIFIMRKLDRKNLPLNKEAEKAVDQTILQFESVIEGVPAAQFIRRYKVSIKKQVRKQLQNW